MYSVMYSVRSIRQNKDFTRKFERANLRYGGTIHSNFKTGPWAYFLTNFDIKVGILVVDFFKRFFLCQIVLTKENLSPKFSGRGNQNKSKKITFLPVPPICIWHNAVFQ